MHDASSGLLPLEFIPFGTCMTGRTVPSVFLLSDGLCGFKTAWSAAALFVEILFSKIAEPEQPVGAVSLRAPR